MQITEVSVFGVRSAVTTFRHPSTPLRFVLLPMIHFGRRDYYQRVARRLATCGLVVAEGYDGPSSTGLAYLTAMRLTGQRGARGLVHQDIDYAALGVPVLWPDALPVAGRRDRIPMTGWLDLATLVPFLTVTMAVGGRDWLFRRNYQIDDDTEPRLRSKFLNRVFLTERDEDLLSTLSGVHEKRATEPIEVGVVYGAAHLPAVVRLLVGKLGYRPQRDGEWLTAIDF